VLQFDVCCKGIDQNFDCGCDRYAILRLDSLVRFTRPSGSVFAYCKRSTTGAREGLGTRLATAAVVACSTNNGESALHELLRYATKYHEPVSTLY